MFSREEIELHREYELKHSTATNNLREEFRNHIINFIIDTKNYCDLEKTELRIFANYFFDTGYLPPNFGDLYDFNVHEPPQLRMEFDRMMTYGAYTRHNEPIYYLNNAQERIDYINEALKQECTHDGLLFVSWQARLYDILMSKGKADLFPTYGDVSIYACNNRHEWNRTMDLYNSVMKMAEGNLRANKDPLLN